MRGHRVAGFRAAARRQPDRFASNLMARETERRANAADGLARTVAFDADHAQWCLSAATDIAGGSKAGILFLIWWTVVAVWAIRTKSANRLNVTIP